MTIAAPSIIKATPERLAALKAKIERYSILEEKQRCEENLLDFLKGSWASIDSAPFMDSWAIDSMCDHLEAVTLGHIPRLLINIPPRCTKTTLVSIIYPAWTWARSEVSFLSGPQVRFLCASYNHSLSLDSSNKSRRLLFSPWFQKLWPGKIVMQKDQDTKGQYDNTSGGSRIATSVGGSLLGLGGDILIGDDLNNTEQVESEADRAQVMTFWNEFHSTRLNDPKKSAIIAVQQRLHKSDVSGMILDSDEDWVHLCYDDQTEILTKDGWIKFSELKGGAEVMAVDPATLEAEWQVPTRYVREHYRGELIQFKSMTADLAVTPDHRIVYGDQNDVNGGKCEKWRVRPANMLPSNFYLPQIVNWRGNSPRKIDFAGRDWDSLAFAEFMGWYLSEGCASAKRRTTRIVQNMSGPHVADIDRVMGSIPFHVWKGKNRKGVFLWQIKSRPLAEALEPFGKSLTKWAPQLLKDLAPQYLQAFILAYARGDGHFAVRNAKKITIGTGSKVMADDLQECAIKAGWSASLSINQQKSGTLFNGYPRRAGFVYKVYIRASKAVGQERKIGSRIRPGNTTRRKYDGEVFCVSVPSTAVVVRRNGRVSVSGNCLPMHYDERRPCVTVKLPQYEDDEPWSDTRADGELLWPERFGAVEVKKLEDALGPYMAAGRLEQSPVPKGGGIIKRDWWQPWDQEEARRYGLEWNGGLKEFPQFELVTATLDTSYGEKQENDYNAMTVWGVWLDRNRNRRAMLMYAWRKRMPLHGKIVSAFPNEAKVNFEQRQKEAWGLVELVADTCKRYKVKRLLIEDKTRGRDVANEINRLYTRENWGVELINPIGDKVSRVHSIVPLFTDNAVWAPDTKWSEMVIIECMNFPKADHDDLVDACSMAIGWMRENGILIRGDESSAALEDEMRYVSPGQSIAAQYGV